MLFYFSFVIYTLCLVIGVIGSYAVNIICFQWLRLSSRMIYILSDIWMKKMYPGKCILVKRLLLYCKVDLRYFDCMVLETPNLRRHIIRHMTLLLKTILLKEYKSVNGCDLLNGMSDTSNQCLILDHRQLTLVTYFCHKESNHKIFCLINYLYNTEGAI